MYKTDIFMYPCLVNMRIEIHVPMNYTNTRKAGDTPYGRREDMTEGMTNAQLDTLLEQLAKLIESSASTVQEAAEIIRQAKTEK